MVDSYRKLEVWIKAKALVVAVYALLKKFPVEERFAMCDQLRRAVVSIPSNIAEGFGRESHADFAHFLAQARGSLYEVETQLEVSIDLGYLTHTEVPFDQTAELGRMLSSFIRRLRSTPTL